MYTDWVLCIAVMLLYTDRVSLQRDRQEQYMAQLCVVRIVLYIYEELWLSKKLYGQAERNEH